MTLIYSQVVRRSILSIVYCLFMFSHAMLAVGYSDHSSSFIVRNSWGKYWVEKRMHMHSTSSIEMNFIVMLVVNFRAIKVIATYRMITCAILRFAMIYGQYVNCRAMISVKNIGTMMIRLIIIQ
jgi:hypothetical protein